jgi:peptidoglycan/xylan/chitin deacetylase (PgdA/CDA1 family)
MYFNDSNNFFHGIMFHHFHDKNIHSKGQGSISNDDFYKIIKFIGRKNILDAEVFLEKYKKKKLEKNHVCFTFDDSIRCQLDVALPVLEEFKIKSFFFVYTSIFEENPDNLEVFRHFRMTNFENINDFYKIFFQNSDLDYEKIFKENTDEIELKRNKFPYYSTEDIKFRLIRDNYLTKLNYEKIMYLIMDKKNFAPKDCYKKLFFQKNDLIKLDKLGHYIGLHSHNHPISIEKLSYEEQLDEYSKNLLSIANILGKSKKDIKCMSHPCGSYNKNSLKILSDLGVELGFKQIMSIEHEKGMKKINNSFLEIAREDHSKIFKRIKNN